MKHIKLPHQKSKAQAIVEFAIALPVLLLLLYGLLETGRYLFLYSTIVNSSRQAVRYASATGLGDGGIKDNNIGIPRYQDCNGIRARATQGAYVATFDSIVIKWDEGPADTTPTTYCSGATDTSLTSSMLADNSHRVTVEVHYTYSPLVPRLVPFTINPIVASSSRTVLLSVSIEVTSASTLSGTTPTSTTAPTLTFTPTDPPTHTPTPSSTFTPSPTYTPITYTPTNTSTPTATFTPSNTPTPSFTPTPSYTPTASKTPIGNCNLVTHGPETISGTTFSMTINNPTGVALQVLDVTVFWNHDGGHKTGSDKSLLLQDASITSSFWSGNIYSTNYTIIPDDVLLIPTGTSTITFTFHQSYTKTNGSERIFINFETNGCQGYPIDSND